MRRWSCGGCRGAEGGVVVDRVERSIGAAARMARAAWLLVRWLRRHRTELAAVAGLVLTLATLLL